MGHKEGTSYYLGEWRRKVSKGFLEEITPKLDSKEHVVSG